MFDLTRIQDALRQEKLDGWLFFDHHERDPLAYRILGFAPPRHVSRRWYYIIPAEGAPRGLVHRVEATMLDALPGEKLVYSSWDSQRESLARLLEGCRRVAMQYSPDCAIPYVSLVDAGTVELVRSLGVDVRGSADLVQFFEARWSQAQYEMHREAGKRVDRIRAAAFEEIARRLGGGSELTEWDIKRFILESFGRENLYTDHGPIVAVNANASNPHYEPAAERHSPIRRGDLVLIDMWAKLAQAGAVYYDITWTGYCGAAPPCAMREVFTIVREARDKAISAVQSAISAGRPIRGYEVDDAARGHIVSKGYGEYFVHRTGHSIGQEVHGAGANMDNLETHDERRIIAGTCFSVEPGIYLADFGIRSEVNVYAGEDSAAVTGEVQSELVALR